VRPRLNLALLLAACATAPAKPPEPMPMRPPERSSIDAVLSHTAELHLTDAQVERLRSLDDEREQKLADLGIHRPKKTTPTGEIPPVGSAMNRPSGMGRGSMGGPGGMGGMGGRGMGGMGMGGGGPRGPRADDPEAQARREERQQRIDDADTQAFLQAVETLSPEQQEPARTIASKYREALYDFRNAMKKRGLTEER
jgi:hypothetical protein